MQCWSVGRKRPDNSPSLPPPRMIDRRDVPILINSFNRLYPLELLAAWLRRAGQRNLVVLDNASSYPPLLRYLARLERDQTARVIRLGENLGHLAPWRSDLLTGLGIDTEFVYTDPDIVPDPACPCDLVARLQALLRDEPALHKAGPGLRVDDIPVSFAHRTHALAWERQFWTRPAAPGVFLAKIDTTFALYRPGGTHGRDLTAARLGWPYMAAHLGWWVDAESPSEEDEFYRRWARRDTSSWSFAEVDPLLTGAPLGSRQLLRLGTGSGPWHGYVNCPVGPLDLPDGMIDAIHADGAFRALQRDRRAWSELRRVLRHGGRMVVRGPARPLAAMLSSPALGSGWAADSLTLTPAPAEAILHLRAVATGDSRPPPAIRRQGSRLDLDVDFAVPLAA